MKRSWWRTGLPIEHTQPTLRPTGGQLLRQLALLILILLIWGGGFFVYLGATNASGAASVVQVVPTSTPAVSATSTPTLAATNTPLPAFTATTASTAAPMATTAAPTAAPRPTDVPTSVPATAAVSPVADVASSYQRDVQPIFDRICVKCHGGEEVKEGLSLKTYAEIMQGSDNGPVIVPGDPANSFLIEQVVTGKMPKKGPKLLPAQIRAITEWVAAGALDN